MCILGLALVGNDAVTQANHCVSSTTGALCFVFLAVIMVVELGHSVLGGEP